MLALVYQPEQQIELSGEAVVTPTSRPGAVSNVVARSERVSVLGPVWGEETEPEQPGNENAWLSSEYLLLEGDARTRGLLQCPICITTPV